MPERSSLHPDLNSKGGPHETFSQTNCFADRSSLFPSADYLTTAHWPGHVTATCRYVDILFVATPCLFLLRRVTIYYLRNFQALEQSHLTIPLAPEMKNQSYLLRSD